MKAFFQKGLFKLENHYYEIFLSSIRIFKLRIKGAKVGRDNRIAGCYYTWANKISIGNKCVLERNITFRYDGIFSAQKKIIIGNNVFIGANCEFNISEHINIGNDVLIASGCKFIDHDHGMAMDTPMNIQRPVIYPIHIEDDVWIGVNAIILKGVRIGQGAVVAAGSVVTKNVNSFEVVAGNPAIAIKKRKHP